MQDTLPEGALHVCHALRQSARMPATALSAAAASPNASWSFEPGPFIVLAGLTFVYVRRWRAVDASVGRLRAFLAGMALRGDRALLPRRLARRAPVPHAHGPAPPAARPRADPRAARAHEGPAAPGRRAACCGSSARSDRSPARSSRSPCTSASMWIWHIPALYDARARAPGRPRPRAHVLRRRRRRCTGGTCCRRSAPGTSAAWAPSSTCSRRRCSSALLGIALTFAPGGALRLLRGPARLLGPVAPAPTRRSAA